MSYPNEQRRAGSMSVLRQALEMVMNAHTRDDPMLGFTVQYFPSVDFDIQKYNEAWRIIREALGYQTQRPEDEEGETESK